MQPTQALLKRYRKLPLTTKDIKKGFYKGTRTGSMGRHTKYGGYVIDWNKVRTYVVPPGLDTFKVRRPCPSSPFLFFSFLCAACLLRRLGGGEQQHELRRASADG